MNTAITVEAVSKVYDIGTRQTSEGQYRTIRESLTNGALQQIQRLGQGVRSWIGGDRTCSAPVTPKPSGEFWALNNISFEVQPGEVVGIVGNNGAGKSTLLKILSRITDPTRGRIQMQGRLSSLLEVGTGFHPELTGRENIYLNGAILGMSRQEITRKFDAIVDFAEIEAFLDMPVKRYSSGMYVRLAFAVASHLEPEILVIDEVLAVGDAAFQRKCLGRISKESRGGRTVLFVSHNMSAVKSLCDRAILIDRGRIIADGGVDDTVNHYFALNSSASCGGLIPEDAERYRDVSDVANIRSVRLTDSDGNEVSQLYYGQPFRVEFTCDMLEEVEEGHFEISICTREGTHVIYSRTDGDSSIPSCLTQGCHKVSANFDVVLLPRTYTFELGIHRNDGTTLDMVRAALDFTVLRVAESGERHYPWPIVRGHVLARPDWNHMQFHPEYDEHHTVGVSRP